MIYIKRDFYSVFAAYAYVYSYPKHVAIQNRQPLGHLVIISSSPVSTECEQKNSGHESSPGWEELLSPRKIAPPLDHSFHSRNEIARLPFVSRFLHPYATYIYFSHCYSIEYSTNLKNANRMFPCIVRDASTSFVLTLFFYL